MKFKVLKRVNDGQLNKILNEGDIIERDGERAKEFKSLTKYFELIKEAEEKPKRTRKQKKD